MTTTAETQRLRESLDCALAEPALRAQYWEDLRNVSYGLVCDGWT